MAKDAACNNQLYLEYLNVLVAKMLDGKLAVHPYLKPTDCSTYLDFHSFHPRQQRDNIPYGQLLRLKTNSSTKEDYEVECKKLLDQFRLSTVLQHQVKINVEWKDRQMLLKTKETGSPQKSFTFAFDYMPMARTLSKIILRH